VDRVSATGYQVISGGRRTFQNKNLGAAIIGTTLDQLWFAGAQECIIGVYEQIGITPADATLGSVDLQLLQAVRQIGAGNGTATAVPTLGLTAGNAGIVFVSAAGNNVALTLPLANSANGQVLRYTFIRQDNVPANSVTLALSGGDTLFPTQTMPLQITGQWTVLSVVSDGISHWYVESEQANFSSGGSTSLAFPGASASAGTVGSSGWTRDPSGKISNWAAIQLVDGTNTAWTFPKAFATGVLKFRSQNASGAAGQSSPATVGIAELVSTNGTTTATFVCRNTGTPGTLCAFELEAEGY
jgi:hypothetical protein